ncbi:MAG: hypothetical protein L0099_13600, partial [Acidobacteria bacterium]|nr:hypothetical protein [Acidobacteriota bacterium]
QFLHGLPPLTASSIASLEPKVKKTTKNNFFSHKISFWTQIWPHRAVWRYDLDTGTDDAFLREVATKTATPHHRVVEPTAGGYRAIPRILHRRVRFTLTMRHAPAFREAFGAYGHAAFFVAPMAALSQRAIERLSVEDCLELMRFLSWWCERWGSKPMHGCNTTVNVDQSSDVRPSSVWTQPCACLLMDCARRDGCVLSACSGHP